MLVSLVITLPVVFRLEDEAERAGSLLGLIVAAGGLGHNPQATSPHNHHPHRSTHPYYISKIYYIPLTQRCS